MKRHIVCLLVFLFVSVSVSAVSPAYAGDPIKKLSRGFMNTATGWIELFAAMRDSYREHPFIGGFVYGIPLGLTRALLRTSAGVYETLTFFIPFPPDYEHIIEPEFVAGFESPMEDMATY